MNKGNPGDWRWNQDDKDVGRQKYLRPQARDLLKKIAAETFS